jgi:hypothetical protein
MHIELGQFPTVIFGGNCSIRIFKEFFRRESLGGKFFRKYFAIRVILGEFTGEDFPGIFYDFLIKCRVGSLKC